METGEKVKLLHTTRRIMFKTNTDKNQGQERKERERTIFVE